MHMIPSDLFTTLSIAAIVSLLSSEIGKFLGSALKRKAPIDAQQSNATDQDLVGSLAEQDIGSDQEVYTRSRIPCVLCCKFPRKIEIERVAYPIRLLSYHM
ncbi:hypothetical protein EV127DRAFT_26279 [Xylaria flabelliformis]|nr:hypothetical protein EV127DRAFT_26279 [Xylaria flabelliformis]